MKLMDLRNKPVSEISCLLADPGDKTPMLAAWQVCALGKELPPDYVVVVPDFLKYARMLSTGQATKILKLPENNAAARRNAFGVVARASLSPLAVLRTDFWFAAKAMLRYDLAFLPKRFEGHVLLHSYLADLAFAFDRADFIREFFALTKGLKAGIQTQQLQTAVSFMAAQGVRPALVTHSTSIDHPYVLPELVRTSENFQYTTFLPDASYLPVSAQRKLKHAIFSA